MKKAILVIGCSERDTLEIAKKIQAQNEEQSQKTWKIVSEKQILEDYIKSFDLNSLCLFAWLDPIKNPVIVDLLNKTEKEIENPFVEGIIICGQFALDETVRESYIDILEEQGYEVELYPVYTPWSSLLTACMTEQTSVKNSLKNWNLFTKQFCRQYVPLDSDQKKAVIVSPEIVTCKEIPGSFELVVMLEALQSRGYVIVVIDDSNEYEKTKTAFREVGFPDAQVFCATKTRNKTKDNHKIDVFWTSIANYFNVKLVIEHNAETLPKWRDIGLPVISLTSVFDVEVLV